MLCIYNGRFPFVRIKPLAMKPPLFVLFLGLTVLGFTGLLF